MAVEILWDNDEKTILRYQVNGRWTWDEFWSAFNQSLRMTDEVDHMVDFIFGDADIAIRSLPPGLLTQLGAVVRRRHPRAGTTVFLASERSSVRTVWYRLAIKMYPRIGEKYAFATTLDEARALLAERRTSGSVRVR